MLVTRAQLPACACTSTRRLAHRDVVNPGVGLPVPDFPPHAAATNMYVRAGWAVGNQVSRACLIVVLSRRWHMPRPVPESCPSAAAPVWSSCLPGKEAAARTVMLTAMVVIFEALAHVV